MKKIEKLIQEVRELARNEHKNAKGKYLLFLESILDDFQEIDNELPPLKKWTIIVALVTTEFVLELDKADKECKKQMVGFMSKFDKIVDDNSL